MITRTTLPTIVIAVLTAIGVCAGSAWAKVQKPGTGGSNKNSGVHHPVHGPGSTHNPIVRHPPLHGAGSSHNPIVVPRDCNVPNTLCRRP
jgi:hypothetical protein